MNNMGQLEGKRITLKRSRPNPLFRQWLEELYDESKAKKSKLEPMLKEALESMSKYPLPLESGMECAVLKGFDKKLCSFLDKRIETYNYNLLNINPPTDTNIVISPRSQSNSNNNDSNTLMKPSTSLTPINNGTSSRNENVEIQSQLSNSADSESSNRKVSKVRKQYKPEFRSGSYGILVGLLEHLWEDPCNPNLKKEQLIEKAQPHSEESFTRPKPDSFYTAWSSMSRLVAKGLVKQLRSNKTTYSLTEDGVALANKLLEDYKNRPTLNDIIFNGASHSKDEKSNNSSSYNSSTQNSQVSAVSQRTDSELITVELPAGSFDIVLLIDKQERAGGARNKKDPTMEQFNKYPHLKHEYRNLKVGDYTWIAQHQVHKDQELVLPWVAERKRMDDLGHSIKDGRFHEQKFRLRKCGLPNVIYLVENFGSNKHVGLPMQSLMQALSNTRVQDGFKVHITDSLNNTARFLAMMTKRLTIEYMDKHLTGTNADRQEGELMIFSYFNKASTKNKPLTVTETFIKLLLQLKGVSVEKALAITNVYQSPKSLIRQYENCSQREGEALLVNLKYGNSNRNVGPAVSKAIYKFFVWREG